MNEVEQWLEEYAEDPDYQFELTSIAIGEEIVQRLLALNMTRSDLARKLGVSRPRVTQILAGDENLTVRTLVAVAVALGSQLTVSLTPVGPRTSSKHGERDELLQAGS